jgi:squalene-associated FAD-dependent desaturase
MRERNPVVVVGAGWSGLATAAELCAHGVPVTVLESARQPGGRARTIHGGGMTADNGQHLFIGAYSTVLELMTRIGVDHQRAFLRLPLTLTLLKGTHVSLHLKAPRLPAPLHMLGAMLGARGMSARDRLRAMQFGRRLPRLRIAEREDVSVQALLRDEGQTPELIRKLWAPLCIAALNTPLSEASARVFLRALRETFLGARDHSDLLIPRLALSELLPSPCAAYLERRGARLDVGQRVTGLDINDTAVRGVRVAEHRIDASHVVLATPHLISRRLMSAHPSLHVLCDKLAQLGNEPVATLYLQYPQQTRLPQPVLGLEDALAQWVFDRRVCGQPGLMAVVMSARGAHAQMTGETLTKRIAAELASSFPYWPAHQNSLLIREKRATFSSRVGIDQLRPANRTPVSGLWLAGDYTANGLPATLEGAVRSGITCARGILGERSNEITI